MGSRLNRASELQIMLSKTTRAPCTARRRAPRRRLTTPRRRRPGSSAAASFVAGPLLEKRPPRSVFALDRSTKTQPPPSLGAGRRAARGRALGRLRRRDGVHDSKIIVHPESIEDEAQGLDSLGCNAVTKTPRWRYSLKFGNAFYLII